MIKFGTFCLYLAILIGSCDLFSQHTISVDAAIDTKEHRIQVKQKVIYQNNSNQTLDTVYFSDWANAFSKKTTPLAKRFSENFKSNFHFERSHNRGKTILHSLSDSNYNTLQWKRGNELDILYALPKEPIPPGGNYEFNFVYEVKLPNAKFTRFGHLKNGDYNLRYWLILPAVFDEKWNYYSHKNLNDFYMPPSNFNILFKAPENYTLTSDFDFIDEETENGFKTTILSAKNRNSVSLYLQQENKFEIIFTDDLEVHTSINDKGIFPPLKAIQIDRIINFLENELGPYPFKKLVVSNEDYKINPAYGLNQLPDFIRPFPDGFQYDIEQLKTITGTFLRNTFQLNPRDEHWFYDGMQVYLMKKYTDTYYPNMKIIGNLSNIWGIRWLHAAQLDFNDQYGFLYMNSARLNLDQALATPLDSLIKYNAEIASGYKGGVGLNYLNEYLENDVLSKSMKEFYNESVLKLTSAKNFENILKANTDKNIDWFFDDYIGSNKKIDYKISQIKEKDDSLHVTIKNKSNHTMPFPLFGMHKKDSIYSTWQEGFESTKTIVLPKEGVDRFAIDYNQIIPEFNKRNNYRKVKGLFKKPLQFRILQDIEDPEYHQIFAIPIFEYNLYDGFTMGPRLYNKTVLVKDFTFKIDPLYGFTSQTLVGGLSLNYTLNFQNQNLYSIRFGTSYNRFSYNTDLFYNRINLWSSIAFREKNLRSNKKQFLNIRNVTVNRDINLDVVVPEEPNYNVFNLQYVYSNVNLIDHFRYKLDYELSDKFQKLHATVEYRKLFLSNRQLNLRLFAGTFLQNNEQTGSDFFSFALDRPTDYLFDYNYYGRSEDTGIFSQQLIIAEGGFKSKLDVPFANRWITTLNASTNIWKWILVYGDVGLVNNKGLGTNAFYDSGIRVNLVADFFELYFPLYSSNGWEPGQDRYDQKIRFIVTLNPETLLRLFTRRWY